jgi:hypothetical protein
MVAFVPLTQTLKDWFDTPMSALPDDIRAVVEDLFYPIAANLWDRLTPAQRCDLAQQDDNQSDPGKAGERQQGMAIAEQRIDLETKIQELQNAQAPTVRDVVLRDQKIEELKAELVTIEHGGWPANLLPDFDQHGLSQKLPPPKIASTNDGSNAPPDLKSRDSDTRFAGMDKLTFDELSIAFVGDKLEGGIGANGMLEITARRIGKRLAWADFDLINRNTGSLNKHGVMLLGLARVATIPSTTSNKTVSRLREALRKNIGLSDDPFERRQSGIGWKPRFKVADMRGDADERARRFAEGSGKISFEQIESFLSVDNHDEEFGDDAADAWLNKHDPDR